MLFKTMDKVLKIRNGLCLFTDLLIKLMFATVTFVLKTTVFVLPT